MLHTLEHGSVVALSVLLFILFCCKLPSRILKSSTKFLKRFFFYREGFFFCAAICSRKHSQEHWMESGLWKPTAYKRSNIIMEKVSYKEWEMRKRLSIGFISQWIIKYLLCSFTFSHIFTLVTSSNIKTFIACIGNTHKLVIQNFIHLSAIMNLSRFNWWKYRTNMLYHKEMKLYGNSKFKPRFP